MVRRGVIVVVGVWQPQAWTSLFKWGKKHQTLFLVGSHSIGRGESTPLVGALYKKE